MPTVWAREPYNRSPLPLHVHTIGSGAHRPVAPPRPRRRSTEGVADGAGRNRGGLIDSRPAVTGVEKEEEEEVGRRQI